MQEPNNREFNLMNEIACRGPAPCGHRPTVSRLIRQGLIFNVSASSRKEKFELTEQGQRLYKKIIERG